MEFLNGHYAIGGFAKLILFNFLQLVIPAYMADTQTCEVGATLVAINIGSNSVVWQ
jgi:hypothetical protein